MEIFLYIFFLFFFSIFPDFSHIPIYSTSINTSQLASMTIPPPPSKQYTHIYTESLLSANNPSCGEEMMLAYRKLGKKKER